ncbi:MAG: hypothetical protein WB992_08860, partial [Bryobacteraceae bacterium]
EMADQVRLGKALQVISPGDASAGIFAGVTTLAHAKVSASAQYDSATAMTLFFSDVEVRTPRKREEFEQIGRATKLSLLDPQDSATEARHAALITEAIWRAMDQSGNLATFGQIPEIQQRWLTFVGAIGADWADIAWWADAMVKVAPKLSDLLAAVEKCKSADVTQDAQFMRARDALASVMGGVVRNCRSAFGDGWGMAVMFALSGGTAQGAMDISCNSHNRHFESRPQVAAAP